MNYIDYFEPGGTFRERTFKRHITKGKELSYLLPDPSMFGGMLKTLIDMFKNRKYVNEKVNVESTLEDSNLNRLLANSYVELSPIGYVFKRSANTNRNNNSITGDQ